MRVLLDTHVFLWWVSDDARLSSVARNVIASSETVLFSVASVWEMAIKMRLGRLEIIDGDLESFLRMQLTENRFDVLPIQLTHATALEALPLHHRDPFDRMLVCQSLVEEVPIVTADRSIPLYDVDVIW